VRQRWSTVETLISLVTAIFTVIVPRDVTCPDLKSLNREKIKTIQLMLRQRLFPQTLVLVLILSLHEYVTLTFYRLFVQLLSFKLNTETSQYIHCVPKKSTFLFLKYLRQILTDFNDLWCVKSRENFTSMA